MLSSWLYGLESKGGFTVYDTSVHGGNMLYSWLYGLESKGCYTVYDISVVETCCPHNFMDLRARAALQFMILQCMVETCCPHDFMDFRARAVIQFMIFQWWDTCCPHDCIDFRQGRLFSLCYWYFSGGNILSLGSWLYGLENKGGYTVYDTSVVETCCPRDFMDLRARAALQFMILQCMVESCCPRDFMDFRARAAIQFMIFQWWKHVVLITLRTLEQERLYSLWYFSGGIMLSSWLYGL